MLKLEDVLSVQIAGGAQPYTPEWFAERMDIIARKGRDPLEMHKLADALMLEMLTHMGCQAGVERFRVMAKWYI